MITLLWLVLAIGALPLAIGLWRLPRGGAAPIDGRALAAGTILCALAFNLTFFWQELWLVIPKAMTPGLHPILYHNDHDWTGTAPIVELLQGSGAIATLLSGLAFLIADAANVIARGVLRGASDVRYAAVLGIVTAWVTTPPRHSFRRCCLVLCSCCCSSSARAAAVPVSTTPRIASGCAMSITCTAGARRWRCCSV